MSGASVFRRMSVRVIGNRRDGNRGQDRLWMAHLGTEAELLIARPEIRVSFSSCRDLQPLCAKGHFPSGKSTFPSIMSTALIYCNCQWGKVTVEALAMKAEGSDEPGATGWVTNSLGTDRAVL